MSGFVTILMPALNEEAHIGDAIGSLLASASPLICELIVLDGGSRDGTCAIVKNLAKSDPRIKLLHNPKRLQAAAINLGALWADPRATILLRADCHALYPEDFVEQVTAPLREKRAHSVVVPMVTKGGAFLQRAIAYAQNSVLGNGGAAHRKLDASGYVDHGHHAAIFRHVFAEIGGYRDDMAANEDAEFDLRLRRLGYSIWLAREAAITYFPRKTFGSLTRQYFKYGVGRATTCFIHQKMPRLRQALPLLITLVCSMSLLLSPWFPFVLILPFSYALLAQAMAFSLAIKNKDAAALLSGLAAMVMHLSWGIGFIKGLIIQSAFSGTKGIATKR